MAYNQNTREIVKSRESKSPRDSGRSKKSYQSPDKEFGISRVQGSKATKSLKLFAYTSVYSLLLLKLFKYLHFDSFI